MWAGCLVKILIFFTLCLILLGGVVHGTGSSLACPDWPTCYGSLIPTMEGNVAIEHSHRLLASTVGLLTIILCVLLLKGRGVINRAPTLRRLGIVALVLVIVQGVLGGLTVIYQLPDLVSTAHLGTSMLFLSILVWIYWTLTPGPSPEGGRGGRKYIIFVTIIIYLQILLGAFVRHTGSGIVCTTFPACYGSLWPSGVDPSVLLHMSHRWMAALVVLLVVSLPLILRKHFVNDSRLLFLSVAAVFFVFLQFVLGILSVVTSLGLIWVTAHLLVAALLLMTMISLIVIL